jgi:DMSO/TMAO reductase YedYZ molybdopterin-dependent catalytic subunit
MLAAAAIPLPSQQKREMIVLSSRAVDLEMPLEGFLEGYLTPVERFFVRSHHYTPKVDAAAWKLKLEGKVANPQTLTLGDLKQFPRVELVSVLECAGNGRGLYEPSMPGLQWMYGSVGNARWAGVRLADVLKRAGVQPGSIEALFDGADSPVGSQPEFQRAIPMAKAMDPNTMLAYEMNGKDLTPDHGYPLRLVVPGWAGDSWMKWVTRIEIRDKEFDGFFMKTGYRHPNKPVPPGTAVDPAQMVPVTSLRVKSVIASIRDKQSVAPGPLNIRGAAWSNGSPVAMVEISTDGGRRWSRARLGKESDRFGWRLFEYAWTPPQEAYYTIMARAQDAAGETQPFVQEWNPSGYSNNKVHAVRLNVTSKPPAASAAPPANDVPAPAEYRQVCLGCHGEEAIVQQRLSRTQWERELEKMQRWGAPVTPQNQQVLLDYLSRRAPYRPRE